MATIPKKKPRNQMALAKLIADIATGEVEGKELTLKEAKSLVPAMPGSSGAPLSARETKSTR